jgi:hypothetical protein
MYICGVRAADRKTLYEIECSHAILRHFCMPNAACVVYLRVSVSDVSLACLFGMLGFLQGPLPRANAHDYACMVS